MLGRFGQGLGALALCIAAGAASPALSGETAAPGFDLWGGEGGFGAYHRLTADCGTLRHAHGRNAAWGLWKLPLAQTTATVEAGASTLTVTCTDGAACIEAGALSSTPGRITSHAVIFDTADQARAFAARLDGHRRACGL